MNRLSLRWVVLVPLLATIVVGFVAFAVYIDRADRETRLRAIDGELTRAAQVDGGASPPGRPGPDAPPAPSGAAVAATGVDPPVQLVVSTDGDVVSSQDENPFSPEDLLALGSTREVTTSEVGDHRVLASPQPDGQVRVTALPLAAYDAATDALRRSLLVGGLVIVALESAMAWWLAGRLVRPLAAIAAGANRIAAGALDTQVQPAGGSREVFELSTDIDRMVTRLRSALTERELAAAAATRAHDDMKRFLADASHEFRTPLTALRGYSDLYARGMLSEPGALDRAMSRVGSESGRLHRLVSSLLELTRAREPITPATTDVDVTEVVREVVDDLRAAYPGRQIELEVGAARAGTVVADPDRIHQALLNLGANACTHTDPRTAVVVRLESTPDAVAVSVIDHGAGIVEEERERIFLPFARLDPSRVRAGQVDGAGLGLAVTRQVVDEHGGSVRVVPTPGGGATFVLRLPKDRAAPPTSVRA